jgi:hypothetical protein
MPERRTCAHVNNDKRCKATPQRDSEFCFFHNPAKGEARSAARRRGGMRSHGQYSMVVDSKAKAPQTAGELKALLAELTAGVLRGHVDPKVLEVVSRSATVQLQAIKIADLERRLAEIEKATK